MIDEARALKVAVDTGKVILGARRARRAAKEKKARLLVLASNCPEADLKTLADTPVPAISLAAGAVLFHQGRTLVYVKRKSDKYERREVQILGREGGRWLVVPRRGNVPIGVAAGEAVVSRQAQIVLSEEFRNAGDND